MGFSSRYVLPSSQRQTLRGKDKPPAKRRPLTLTRKQELFVKELITKDGTITQREAAINAGYSPKTASAIASNMLNPNVYPHVYKEYMRQKRELDSKYAVRKDRHLRDLQVIRDTAMQNGAYSAAVMAEYRRGQASGDIYVNKSEIRHGSIESMSKDEVIKALKEIRDSYAIDITPERVEEDGVDPDDQKHLTDEQDGQEVEDTEEGVIDSEEGERSVDDDEGHDESDPSDMDSESTGDVVNTGNT